MLARVHGDLLELRGAVLAPTAANELVPPPRFAQKTFANYIIDPTVGGQGDAVASIIAFATWRKPRLAWWRSRGVKPGLYLDGGFGVGKTHLLAASFHAAHGTRRYLSFAEAMSLVVKTDARRTADLLAADLVCIDEFELDDPANTRLVDLLLEELVARGCRIVTTSNTVPGELGQGRMAADQFRNQLARIADVFTDIHVPGGDHRRVAKADDGSDPPRWGPAMAPWPEAPGGYLLPAEALDELLTLVPVANLRRLATRMRELTITDLSPFTNQLAALRFVHLVDKLYDSCTALRVQATCRLAELFPEQFCQRAFAKKYRRCLSRLVEMCS